MSARDRILARLAGASARIVPPAPDLDAFFAARDRGEDSVARIARFRAALEAAHAEVHETEDVAWPELFCRIATTKGLRNILVGAGAPYVAALSARLPDALKLVSYDRPAHVWREEMFERIDAGLSQAKSAIAETGSIILWPGRSEPRLMSLVPPIHFVLLDAASIHANLYAAMQAEHWTRGLPTNVLLISGPSKTADIQQTLAYGAHGPRELIVLLCHRAVRPA